MVVRFLLPVVLSDLICPLQKCVAASTASFESAYDNQEAQYVLHRSMANLAPFSAPTNGDVKSVAGAPFPEATRNRADRTNDVALRNIPSAWKEIESFYEY